jgi:predicted RNase H-like HicB family nuclease
MVTLMIEKRYFLSLLRAVIMIRVTPGGCNMEMKLRMIYWKGEKFWVGKLLEHPGIMTQGKTLEELEENMKDVYTLMTLADVPEQHEIKELVMNV